MPLDNANYISELNTSNPNGTVDTVDMVDDFLRELKKVLVQSFPNINKQTTITSDELNNLKSHLAYSSGGSGWDMRGSTINNVLAADIDSSVQPRSYNDIRYLRASRMLDDCPSPNWAMANLFNKISVGDSTLYGSTFKRIVSDMAWPVGSIYTNTSRTDNPSGYLGVGTWIAWAQGRVIIGAGSTTDTRGEARGFSNKDASGEFSHVLSLGEMPSHSHALRSTSANPSLDGGQTPKRLVSTGVGYEEGLVGSAGDNQPHNNMMPYISACIWVRTA